MSSGEAPVNQWAAGRSRLSLQEFWESSSPAEGFKRSERLAGGWRYLDLDLSIDFRSLLSMSSFLVSRDLESCRRFSSPSSSDLISELTEEALWPWRPADRAAGKKKQAQTGYGVHMLSLEILPITFLKLIYMIKPRVKWMKSFLFWNSAKYIEAVWHSYSDILKEKKTFI